MVKGSRKTGRILKIFALCSGLLILGGAVFISGHMIGAIPDTIPQSEAVSPDHKSRVTITVEIYGTFGSQLYVVRIGPSSDVLNWLFGKKLIEMDAGDSRTPAPTAAWVGSDTAVIKLPVKPEKLAAAIRDGLFPHPAAQQYGSVQIV